MLNLNQILLSKSNIIISGASGFIGFNFAKYVLTNSDIKIYAYRPKIINTHNDYRIEILKKFNNFKIINFHALDDVSEKIDVVINFASYGVDSNQKDINGLVDGNIMFAINLINIAKRFNAKFIHTSTCYEYEDSIDVIKETAALKPDSLYGAFKASTSLIVKELCKVENVNYVILRLFGVYGSNESGDKLMPYLAGQLIANQNIELTDGKQIRDYTYIDDVVSAFLLISFNENNENIYNVCSSEGISIKDFILKFVKINNLNKDLLKFGKKEMKENKFLKMIGDNSRIRNEYKWERDISFDIGFELVFNSYKKGL
jgi:nucleoside-diphosphate-sugar epimerase